MTSNLTAFSRELRKNMTKEERHLWYDFLKPLPCTVKRQQVIGNYIVDFYCASAKLVIELDGSQHYEESGKNADLVRDAFLESLGLKVLRYSNIYINRNFPGVCEDILRHIDPSSDLAALGHLPPRGKALKASPRGTLWGTGEAVTK